jgi:hypothetical protein
MDLPIKELVLVLSTSGSQEKNSALPREREEFIHNFIKKKNFN